MAPLALVPDGEAVSADQRVLAAPRATASTPYLYPIPFAEAAAFFADGSHPDLDGYDDDAVDVVDRAGRLRGPRPEPIGSRSSPAPTASSCCDDRRVTTSADSGPIAACCRHARGARDALALAAPRRAVAVRRRHAVALRHRRGATW